MDFVERRMAIFKTGIHTDGAGQKKEWTLDDLTRMVETYDPAEHEAPVVIGHPLTNGPAYGWVKKIGIEGDTLWAETEIVPELDDLLQRGIYKKRSISLYEDGRLRHIGFLGATPPAIKGLPDIAFRQEEKAIDLQEDMNEFTEEKEEPIMTKFWDWLTAKAKEEGVEINIPPQFSEAEMKATIDAEVAKKVEEATRAKEAEFAEARSKLDAEIAAREKAIREAEAATRRTEIVQFCEGLLTKGTLTPAMMQHGMGMVNFLEQIAAIETTIEFGEGDTKEKQTPVDFMRSFLARLPKAIEFREIAGSDKDTGPKGGAGAKLDGLVKEKMKADQKLTYGAAFAEVQKEHPDLAAEYADRLTE